MMANGLIDRPDIRARQFLPAEYDAVEFYQNSERDQPIRRLAFARRARPDAATSFPRVRLAHLERRANQRRLFETARPALHAVRGPNGRTLLTFENED
jgi:hypothetical protein